MFPVPTVPIQHTTDAAILVPLLLDTLPPDAYVSVSAPAALLEIPTLAAAIEFFEFVELCSHIRTGCVNDASNRFVTSPFSASFPVNPHVLPDNFLPRIASRKRPPIVGNTLLADKGRLHTYNDRTLLLVQTLTTLPTPDFP